MRNLTKMHPVAHEEGERACRAVLGAMEAEPELAWATIHVGFTMEPGCARSRLVHWEHPIFTHEAVKRFVRFSQVPPDPFTPMLEQAASTLIERLKATLEANMYDPGSLIVDAEAQVDLRGCMELDVDRNTLMRQLHLGAWSESVPPAELRGFLQQVQREALEHIPLGVPVGVSVLME